VAKYLFAELEDVVCVATPVNGLQYTSKETHYFDDFFQDISYYYGLYEHCNSSVPIVMDATPNYINNAPRIYETYEKEGLSQEVKIMITLREPVSREISWYQHLLREHAHNNTAHWVQECLNHDGEPKTFDEFIDSYILPGIVAPEPWNFGLYARWLKEWFDLFPRENILIATYSDLKANETDFLERLHEFLGLPLEGAPLKTDKCNDIHSRLEEPIPCEVQNRLAEVFEPANQELYDLLEAHPGPSMEHSPFTKFNFTCKDPVVKTCFLDENNTRPASLLECHRQELLDLQKIAMQESASKERWELPKQIFMYWDSGLEDGPWWLHDIVKSWVDLNPEYNFVFLSDQNLDDWFPEFNSIWDWETIRMTWTAKSDYLRLYLLLKYGGIWVDSTVFAFESLEWLEPQIQMTNGVYLNLMWLEDGRQISTWFMASALHTRLIAEWLLTFHDYIFRPRNNQIIPIKGPVFVSDKEDLQPYLGPTKSDLTFLNQLEEKYGVSSYFMVHYLFNHVVHNDPSLFPPRDQQSGTPTWKHVSVFGNPGKMQKNYLRDTDEAWGSALQTMWSLWNQTSTTIE